MLQVLGVDIYFFGFDVGQQLVFGVEFVDVYVFQFVVVVDVVYFDGIVVFLVVDLLVVFQLCVVFGGVDVMVEVGVYVVVLVFELWCDVIVDDEGQYCEGCCQVCEQGQGLCWVEFVGVQDGEFVVLGQVGQCDDGVDQYCDWEEFIEMIGYFYQGEQCCFVFVSVDVGYVFEFVDEVDEEE